MKDILLVGGGGHCKAVIEILERLGKWQIVGIVERPGSPLSSVAGYPVVGSDLDLVSLKKACEYALVTVGQLKTAEARMMLYRRLKDAGFVLPVVISPLAQVAKRSVVGEGSVIMDFAAIGPDANVGSNVIVNTRALIEHDACVGSHCHISTGALVNGGVHIGERTFVGSGSVFREGLAIGDGCIIGMGSVVTKNVADAVILRGAAR